jgi:GMP synthase (glutamine-hydrolysing)
MAAPRILVVEHQESCPPALFGDWLEGAGADLHVVRPWRGDDLPDPTSYDGVLVLGGEMSANDDDTVPWLAPLKAGIRSTVAAGVPLLGICLGHQLVASAPDGTLQVARFGPAAWGIQAHPEVGAVVCRRWAESDRDDHLARGVDQEALLGTVEQAAAELAGHWRPLAERFTALAGGAAWT